MKLSPDAWQDEVYACASGITEPGMMPAKPRIALKACKGPGKSHALSVLGWWWLLTRWHSNMVALSITSDNLRDNLWAEMARLYERSRVLQLFFVQSAEKIYARRYERTWWMSARSFPQDADPGKQANTLAGLHGIHPAVLADEVGDYPEGVLAAAEGIFASQVEGKPVEALLAAAGNPTSAQGPLYRICTKDRQYWWVREITGDPDDPTRASRCDIDWCRSQIEQWGRDHDFVKVNVLGQFPSRAVNKLLGPDEVMAAMSRQVDPRLVGVDPLIMGLDVARGGDNSSVLTRRQGRHVTRQDVWRDDDLMSLADRVANEYATYHPAALFVDATGLGSGVVDRLRQLGIPVIAVDPGGSASDKRFEDRRAEMWWRMAKWVTEGGTLPDDASLRLELTAPLIDYAKRVGKSTRVVLESKKDMRKRGVSSPDRADSLALTFAAPVHVEPTLMQRSDPRFAPAGYTTYGRVRGGTEEDWDPYGGG